MGTYALSAGYYDAYYKRAQQVAEQSVCVQNDIDIVISYHKPILHFMDPRLHFLDK